MTQLRYIAMNPIFQRDHREEIVRDKEGQAVVIAWRLPTSIGDSQLWRNPDSARQIADRLKRDDGGDGRVLEVNLDDLPDAGASIDQQYQFAERQMLRWAAEHGRLFDIVHGKTLDKSDRDYDVRVKRNAEWRAHATTEVRRLLEMFKPPDFVIVVERDRHVGGRWDTDKDGKFYQHADRTWPFVVTLRDARLHTDKHEEASDAHIFTVGETEGAAYASMLEHLLAGRGFFPGT